MPTAAPTSLDALQDACAAVAMAEGTIRGRSPVISDATSTMISAGRLAISGLRLSGGPERRLWLLLDYLRGADPNRDIGPVFDDLDRMQVGRVFPVETVTLPITAIIQLLAGLQDPRERMLLPQTVVTAATRRLDDPPDGADEEEQSKYELIYAKRNLAVLRALAPHRDADHLRIARDNLRAGLIEQADYDLFAERAKRTAADRAEGRVLKPTAVARLIGVTRGYVTNKISSREGDELPPYSWGSAVERACRYGIICHRYNTLSLLAMSLRDEAISATAGLIPGAEVARMLGMTPARVSQLRRHGL